MLINVRSFFLLLLLFSSIINGYAQNKQVIKDLKIDFGAKGDGVTDDFNSFKKASEFFQKLNGNGKLIIPYGSYLINNQKDGGKKVIKHSEDVFNLNNSVNFEIAGISNSKGEKPLIFFKKKLFYGTFIKEGFTIKPFKSSKTNKAKFENIATLSTVFKFSKCKKIRVNGLDLDGRIQEQIIGGEYGDKGIQLPHIGIYLAYNSEVELSNLIIKNFGQDAIYIKSNNTKLTNVKCLYNGRQGVSWTDGDTLIAANCAFNYTGMNTVFSAPGAGVDFEPQYGKNLNYARFDNCEFKYNKGYGIVNYGNKNLLSDVKFNNCILVGHEGYVMVFMSKMATFKNCSFYGDIYQSYCPTGNFLKSEQMVFEYCKFSDVYNGMFTKIVNGYLFYLVKPYIIFKYCEFESNNRNLVAIAYNTESSRASSFENCTFKSSFNSKKLLINLGETKIENCVFNINEKLKTLVEKEFLQKGKKNTFKSEFINDILIKPYKTKSNIIN